MGPISGKRTRDRVVAGDSIYHETMTTERPLRVAHLTHTTERGGAELALARLLSIPGRSWEATLVRPEGESGAFQRIEHAEDIKSIVLGGSHPAGASKASLLGVLQPTLLALKQAWQIRRSGVLRTVDVVHANTTRASLYGALATIGTGIPMVVHLRDRIEPGAIGRFGYFAFKHIVAPRTTRFIANSESTRRTVLGFLKPHQAVDVIASPTGMDRARSLSSTGSPHLRIGMVARIDPWKGQELLIDAFSRANLNDVATLVFIGAPAFGHEEYLRRLQNLAARLGITNIEFQGFQEDIANVIDDLDICVQYSTRPEPLGQNVLQYLLRGKATIVAAEGGPVEWVQDGLNGRAIPPRDVDSLANALKDLVSDAQLRCDLGAAALETPGLLEDEQVARAHGDVFAQVAVKETRQTPRVLFVAAPLTARSGVYRSSFELVQAGRRIGADWHLLVGVSTSALGKPRPDTDWYEEYSCEPSGLLGVLRLRRDLRAHALYRDADIIVSLLPQTDMAMALARKPWAAYLRGLPWPAVGESTAAKRVIWQALERIALRRSSAIWVTTEILREEAGLNDSATIVPAGIRRIGRSWTGKGKHNSAVWAARFNVDKNPSLFLTALSDSTVNGVMYGSGELLEEIRDAAPQNVRVVGWADPDKLWADAFVYLGTSHREAFGRSAVEAAMAGIPIVISSAFGAAPLLVTDSSYREKFVLSTSDLKGWIAAVKELHENEELRVAYSEHLYQNALKITIEASASAVVENLGTISYRRKS